MEKFYDNKAKIVYYKELLMCELRDVAETKIINLSVGPAVCGKILSNSNNLIAINERRISLYQGRIFELSKGD